MKLVILYFKVIICMNIQVCLRERLHNNFKYPLTKDLLALSLCFSESMYSNN